MGIWLARLINDMLRNILGVEIRRLTKSPYIKKLIDSQKRGFNDINDYTEEGMDNFASKFMKKLFSSDFSAYKSGKILEIGAGSGRFTREIVKYVSEDNTFISLEKDPFAYKLLKKNVKKYKNVTPIKGDFFDSQDNLIEKISLKSNTPYPLINGRNLEKIGCHFGFIKHKEFNIHFNEQVAKIHIYQKNERMWI